MARPATVPRAAPASALALVAAFVLVTGLTACTDSTRRGDSDAARPLPTAVPTAPAAGAPSPSPAPPEDRALVEAVARGDRPAVEALIARGANPDARDGSGTPVVLLATHDGRPDLAGALIEAGADVNAKDAIGDSAYLYAAAEGHLAILELTLSHGADLRSLNRYGGTGLIPAAHHGHVEVVQRLLRTDVAIDHVNNLGWTALLEAVILGDGGPAHTEIVRLLVEAGADTAIADRDGVTPLEHARRRGFAGIAALIAGGR